MRVKRSSPKFKIILGVLGLMIFLGLVGKGLTMMLVDRRLEPYSPAGEFVCLEDQGCLHVLTGGEGQPVVLLHGDGGSIYDWKLSVLDELKRDYQVTALDRPGFGFSTTDSRGMTVFDQVDLIRDALHSLGIENPILVGHSRGGNIALAYGLLYPEKIKGVVTLAAAPYGGKMGWYSRVLNTPLLGPVLAHTWFVPLGKQGVKAGLEEAFGPESSPPPDYLDAYTAFELRPGQLLAHAFDQVHGREVTPWLRERYQDLQVPVVILHSADDQNVPYEQALLLHMAVPRSRLLELSGSGHEIMFNRPDLVVHGLRMLENFPGTDSDQ